MSANHQKINKMCKNFTKNVHKEAKSLPDLANYEILNTNCTMVGSNNLNLNLDTKLAGYGNNSSTSQVKVCSRPLRSPEVTISGVAALKKPQSPRGSVGSVSPAPSPQPSPQLLGQAAAAAFLQQQQNLVQIIHSPHAHQVLAPRTIIGTTGQHHHIQPSPPQIKLKPQNILPKPPPVLQSKQPSGHPQQPRCSSTGASGGITTVSQHHVSMSGVSGVAHGVPGVPHGLQGVASGLQSLQGVQGVQGVNVGSMGQIVLPGQVPGTLLLNQVPLLVGSGQLGGGGGVQLILRPGTPGTAGAAAGKLPSGPAGTPHLVLQPGTGPQPHQVILQQPNVTNNQRTSQPQQLVRVLTANGMLQSLNPLGALNPLTPTYIMQQPVHSLTQQQQQQQQQQATVNNTSIPQQQQQQTGVGVNNTVSVTSSNKSVQQVQTVQAIEQLPPPKKKPKKKKKNKEPKLDLANIMKLSGIGDEDDIMFESDTSESAVSCDTTPTSTNKIPKSPSPHLQTTQPQELSNNPNSLQLASDFTTKRLGNIHISSISDNLSSNNKNMSISNVNRPDGLLNDTRQSQISVQQSLSDINAINQNLAHIGLINQNQNFVNSQQSDSNLAGILQALNGTNNFSLINGQNYHQKNNFSQQKLPNTHFNLQNPLQNIQVQNFSNSNLILNQITPNLSNISNIPSGFSLNNTALTGGPTTTLLQQNFLSAGLVQSPATTAQVPAEVQGVQGGPFSATNVQGMGGVPRTGGFKLALSEDGRLILQHDPNLNQDIQSQLLLQSIFGINLQGGNLVLTSVSNTTQQTKPLATVSEQIKKQPPPPPAPVHTQTQPSVLEQQASTKTINMLPNTIPSVKTEPQMNLPSDLPQQTPNNYSYIVNLTPDQLELLKRNGQLTVNGQTIFMHKSTNNKDDKNINKSPKGKIKKQPKVENKIQKNILQIPSTNKIFPPNNKEIKTEPEIYPTNQLNGLEQNSIQVEQFLNNLNINPTNLSQLISQKLSQELPSGVDPKIVNISAGAAGQIVAKIDISSDNIPANNMVTSSSVSIDSNIGSSASTSNESLPPLVSMMKQENLEVFPSNHDVLPPTQVQMPSNQMLPTPGSTGVCANPMGNMLNSAPGPLVHNNNHTVELPVPVQSVPQISTGNVNSVQENKVYQRVQTIQLTPQKQQLLKSVQLQIHALSARLQQKESGSECNNTVSLASNNTTSNNNSSDQSEIHTALRHLFLEQQKILATGKIIPNITHAVPCTIEAQTTQTSTNTSSTKTNGTFLTSLLQQPAVSHQSNQKVYYHHGNQIIAINPPPSTCSVTTTPATTTPATILHNTTNTSNTNSLIAGPQANKLVLSAPGATVSPCKKPPVAIQLPPVKQEVPVENKVIKEEKIQVPVSPEKKLKNIYSKAQLIEQQLQTDQNGAMNPDINTPFSSKADAVKRLVRYHCYKQPVLSQKDLSKADEIFELTARHFIDKFRSMVNKYQVLLLKESMRQVQTSELMMIDRMFLSEEQQSLLKLQSDLKLQNELELNNELSAAAAHVSDMTCQPAAGPAAAPALIKTEVDSCSTGADQELDDEHDTFDEDNNHDFNIKCGLNYFGGDESCDSGAHFNHQSFDEFIGLPSQQEKSNTHKTTTNNSNSSYNTTKIIGNFEIEINNKSCNRQKIEKNENFSQKDEDYDEWLCIQRELGYFPENKLETDQKHNETTLQNNITTNIEHNQMKDNKLINNKRTSSDRNCLESLKKYRVEKHNSKGKKSGSIIGEVKFEVRIEHKKVFPNTEQQQQKHQVMKTETSTSNECIGSVMTTTTSKQMPIKRQCFDYSNSDTYSIHSKRTKPDVMCTPFIKQEHADEDDDFSDLCVTSDGGGGAGGGGSETFERSIDEQVQSAIDSILNLQQITSMTEKPALDASDSKVSLLQCSKKDDIFADGPEQTLDEAVKSILS